jgi:pimeloyl-ACP methyl ester carboxylesterase
MPYLQRPDVKIWYEVQGNGPTLLLMSETACHGEIWKQFQVPEFSKDHKVITYDQRGIGKSDEFTGPLTTRMLAEDAAALIDEIGGGPAIVIGHSMGGRVAQWLALDHPGKVAKLVLASSGAAHRHLSGIPLALCVGLIEKGYERFQHDFIVARAFTEAYRAKHPDRVAAFMEMRLANRPPLQTYLQYIIARTAHDSEDRLGKLAVPTLIVFGEAEDHKLAANDVNHIESSRILADKIPNARIVRLEGQNHCYFYTAPDLFNATVRDFLDS